MLHTSSWDVVRHLGDGKAGLEKEGLRVTKDGFMARTRDPFVGDPYIVKDFSENQTEINTPVCSCIGEAVDILERKSSFHIYVDPIFELLRSLRSFCVYFWEDLCETVFSPRYFSQILS